MTNPRSESEIHALARRFSSRQHAWRAVFTSGPAVLWLSIFLLLPLVLIALTLVVIPFWTSLLIRTYAWQILLAPGSKLAQIAAWLGWIVGGDGLFPSIGAVLVGMVCDFLPFLVLPLYASVEKLDWALVEAARDLGAKGGAVFRHAVLPQIRPGLLAGFILVLLPATGQFVIPDLLGGSKTVMLGNAIQQQFAQSRDWPFGAAIACASLALLMIGLTLHARFSAGRNDIELL
jgi:spermidine/putrescine transport system permease protein